MGINVYLVDIERKEYMHLGTGIKFMPDIFSEIQDNFSSYSSIEKYIKDRNLWTKDVTDAFINIIAKKIVEFIEQCENKLILISDDIYQDLHGNTGIVDEVKELINFDKKFIKLFDIYDLLKCFNQSLKEQVKVGTKFEYLNFRNPFTGKLIKHENVEICGFLDNKEHGFSVIKSEKLPPNVYRTNVWAVFYKQVEDFKLK